MCLTASFVSSDHRFAPQRRALRRAAWGSLLIAGLAGGCARTGPAFGPPATATASAEARPQPANPPIAGDEAPLRAERVTFGRSDLQMPGARGGEASLPAQGTLTFSAEKLSPTDLLRIVAGALNLAPVAIDPPPDAPMIDVPTHMSVESALRLLDNVLAAGGEELTFGKDVVYVRKSSGVGDVRLSRNLVKAIRLNFIDNQTFAGLAGSLIPQDRLVLPKGDSSLVIYVGPASGSGSIEKIRPLIDTFDLQGTQAVLLPLRRRNPADLARQVQDAIGGGASALPRIIPLPQRHAVMVVAPQTFDISNVMQLVRGIDAGTPEENTPVRVFTPQHRTAADLLALLRNMGGASSPGSVSAAAGTALPGPGSPAAPGLSPGVSLPAGSPAAAILNGPLTTGTGIAGNGTTAGGGVASAAREALPAAGGSATGPSPGTGTGGSGGQGPGLVPAAPASGGETSSVLRSLLANTNVDRQTNRILFAGSASDFAVLRRALQALDQGGSQILVEALILQVVLNDQLQYGVQYALNNAKIFGVPVNVTDTTGLQTAAGLVLSLGKASTQVIVTALDSVTNVSVISSPKILTVSGETAKFHFGSSVPVLSANLTTSQGNGAALANQVDYRDTGVSLQVTPSAIDSTTADLAISQDLSNVSATTVTGISSPVFDDRQIDTHVRLHFDDTIMLGGLIEHDRNDTDTGIPILRRLDILGPLFGTTNRQGARSEYVLLLTPRLIPDNGHGPRLSDALSLRFERLQGLWDNLHHAEAFPTAAVDRVRQLKGP